MLVFPLILSVYFLLFFKVGGHVCFVWVGGLTSLFVEPPSANLLKEPSEFSEPRKLSEPVLVLDYKILGLRYFREPQI